MVTGELAREPLPGPELEPFESLESSSASSPESESSASLECFDDQFDWA